MDSRRMARMNQVFERRLRLQFSPTGQLHGSPSCTSPNTSARASNGTNNDASGTNNISTIIASASIFANISTSNTMIDLRRPRVEEPKKEASPPKKCLMIDLEFRKTLPIEIQNLAKAFDHVNEDNKSLKRHHKLLYGCQNCEPEDNLSTITRPDRDSESPVLNRPTSPDPCKRNLFTTGPNEMSDIITDPPQSSYPTQGRYSIELPYPIQDHPYATLACPNKNNSSPQDVTPSSDIDPIRGPYPSQDPYSTESLYPNPGLYSSPGLYPSQGFYPTSCLYSSLYPFPPQGLYTSHDPYPMLANTSLLEPIHSDRFIPVRHGNNWDTKFAMISDDIAQQENVRVGIPPRRNRDPDGTRDGVAYMCLLKNELLGTEIDDIKSQSDERKAMSPVESNNLFKYSTSRRSLFGAEPSAPYSLYPISAKSQKLLRSPRKATRKISRIPFKVLDAPELQDDFYLNLVDWSSQNVLSVGLGSCVYLWSACTSQVTRLCDLSSDGNSVTAVSWNERGNLVAVGTHHGYVQVWDVMANKQVNKLQGHTARVGALAWNGEVLSSGSRDRLILQRDVRTPSMIAERKLVGHRQEVCGLKWSPDNQYLASGGNDNRLYVWNMHSLAPVQTYTEHLAAVKAIAWSPHHHGLLASGGGTADRCIRFWNTLTGQPMQCVDTGSQVCNLAWSKHSSELVSTHGYSQNQILVWKYPSLSQVAKLTGHSYRVLYLAMSPDGEAIVTGAGDETLRFWNVFSKARSQKENKSVLNLFNNIR